ARGAVEDRLRPLCLGCVPDQRDRTPALGPGLWDRDSETIVQRRDESGQHRSRHGVRAPARRKHHDLLPGLPREEAARPGRRGHPRHLHQRPRRGAAGICGNHRRGACAALAHRRALLLPGTRKAAADAQCALGPSLPRRRLFGHAVHGDGDQLRIHRRPGGGEHPRHRPTDPQAPSGSASERGRTAPALSRFEATGDSMTENLRGVLTALTTPFDSEENIDRTLLGQVVDRSIDGGVDGLVVGGSTAEFATMSSEERQSMVEFVIDHTAGRVPVVAQTGATSTQEAIRHSLAAQRAGADVLMLVTPYYEPLTLAETIDYIKTVAAAVDIDVMLYNIPGATGINLDPDTVRERAGRVAHIRYINDASADWEQALKLIHHHSDVIGTFIGWDSYIYSGLVDGAAGMVAGAANVVPAEIVSVSNRIADGDLHGSR